jgi:uncharacterized integral membrane protein
MEEFAGTTSFLNLHFVLYQEALCAKSLKLNHVMVFVQELWIIFVQVRLTIANLQHCWRK